MRVLLAHNRYLQPGGEDAVFEAEKALLERMGHDVIPFVEDNARLNGMSPLRAALNAVWSRESQENIRRLIREKKPEVAHFHNTFLMISPAAYYACKEAGVPVVQTLHNFRLLCPNAIFFRSGAVCEECLGKSVPWPGVLHGCWRGRAQTAVVAAMLAVHRALKTWTTQIDRYIALTEFARRKFIEGGLPAEKLVVKPHFVTDRRSRPETHADERGHALFVGRLTEGKGVRTLLDAWESHASAIPLKIVGDGPLRGLVAQKARSSPFIEWTGYLNPDDVRELMERARFLLFPTRLYETFGRVIIEAFAAGTPVIASRIGGAAELVSEERTGLTVRPGDPADLAAKVTWAWEHPAEMSRMGQQARREYTLKYTPERNYAMLMQIYEQVVKRRR